MCPRKRIKPALEVGSRAVPAESGRLLEGVCEGETLKDKDRKRTLGQRVLPQRPPATTLA